MRPSSSCSSRGSPCMFLWIKLQHLTVRAAGVQGRRVKRMSSVTVLITKVQFHRVTSTTASSFSASSSSSLQVLLLQSLITTFCFCMQKTSCVRINHKIFKSSEQWAITREFRLSRKRNLKSWKCKMQEVIHCSDDSWEVWWFTDQLLSDKLTVSYFYYSLNIECLCKVKFSDWSIWKLDIWSSDFGPAGDQTGFSC